jgi:hypothetical protein
MRPAAHNKKKKLRWLIVKTCDSDCLTGTMQPCDQAEPINLMGSRRDCGFIQRGVEHTLNCWLFYFPNKQIATLYWTEYQRLLQYASNKQTDLHLQYQFATLRKTK